MNKIYRVIWNASQGVWVAVSEIAKAKGKTKSIKKATAIGVLTIVTSTGAIAAQTIDDDLIVNGDITVSGTVDGVDVSDLATTVADKADQTALDGLATTVNSKADQTALDSLTTTVNTKADQTDLDTLSNQVNDTTTGLDTKASQTDLDDLSDVVDTKADQTDLDSLTTTVNSKADQTDLDTLSNQVNDPTTGLATKASLAQVAAAKTEVVAGDNIAVTTSTGSDGQTVYNVATTDDVNFNQVTIGDTAGDNTVLTSTSAGLDVGTDKITNLSNGDVSDGSSDAITGDQLYDLRTELFGDSATPASGIKYFRANSTLDDAAAIGTDSVAIGPEAQAQGTSSIAMGQAATALDSSGIAIGAESQALGGNSTAIGSAATSRTISVEYESATSTTVIAINGIPVEATSSTAGSQDINNLTITSINGVDVSTNAPLYTQFLSALQSGASVALGENSFAAGTSTLAVGDSSVALGDSAVAGANNSTAIGHAASSSGSASAALGNSASATGSASTSLGSSSTASGSDSVAVGSGAQALTQSSVSIGDGAGVGTVGTKIGSGATTDRIEHIAIGANSGQNVVGNQNIALGSGAGSNLSVGDTTSSDQNIAIGVNAGSGHNGDSNISIGENANRNVSNKNLSKSVAIGSQAQSGNQAVVLGADAEAKRNNALAAGYSAEVTGASGTALGANTTAGASNVALGANSIASTNSTTASYLVTDTVPTAGFNVVSVGGGSGSNVVTRRITNVAAGGDATDAVNVSQLRQLNEDVAEKLFGTSVTNVSSGVITDGSGNNYTSFLDAIQNLTAGTGTPASSDAVLYNVGDTTKVQLTGAGGTTISNVKTDETDGTSAANVDYVNNAVKDASVKYVSINSTESENENSQEAHAIDSMAIGSDVATTSAATDSVAIGFAGVTAENTNTVAIGSNTTSAKGASSIAIGDDAEASNINNIAMGTDAIAAGIDSIAIGHNTQVDKTGGQSDYAVVIGSSAESQNADNATAIGHTAVVQGDQGIAIGNISKAVGRNSIAMGDNALATGEDAVAIGEKSNAVGRESVAVGDSNNTYATESIAVGKGNNVGLSTVLSGQSQTSLSGVLGNGNNVRASNSFAIGNANDVVNASSDTFILGSNVTNTTNDSVFLGNESGFVASNTTTRGKATYNTETVDGIAYNYAGGTATGVVSVGNASEKRRIQNVAAGLVSASSTDAINGSQLYSTNVALSNLQKSTATNLGGGATVNSDGSVNAPTYTVITNPSSNTSTTYNNVGDALTGLSTAVNRPITFTGDSGSTQRKLGSTLIIKGGKTTGLTENNIGVITTDSTMTVKLAEDIDLGANGSVKMGDTSIDTDGLVIANTDPTKVVSIKDTGISAGSNKITNVAAGDVTSTSTDAVNGSQLYATNQNVTNAQNTANTALSTANKGLNFALNNVNPDNLALGDTVSFNNGTNTTATYDGTTNTYQYNLNDRITLTNAGGISILNTAGTGSAVAIDQSGVQAGNVKLNTSTGKITGLTAGTVSGTSTEGINGTQLFNNASSVSTALGGGSNVSSTGTVIAPSYTVTTNPSTGASTTANNVGDALSGLNTAVNQPLTFAGDTGADVTRQLGSILNVEGGASGTLTDNNIGVVANGTDTLTVKLAEDIDLGATGSVTTGNTVVNTNGLTITNPTDSTKTVSVTSGGINAGGNVISNVAAGSAATDAVNVSQLEDAQAAATTEVVEGKNISVSSSIGTDGQTIYTVATDEDVNFNQVTIGSTTGNNTILTSTADGLSVGGDKITNVAAGTISDTSTDAVNGSQLYDTNQQVSSNTTNIANNTADIADNTAEIAKGLNFGDGATSNNYALGDTINVTEADSNIETTTTSTGVSVGLADDISVESVTVGDSTNSTVLTSTANGLSVNNDKITNVAAGTISDTSTDAVNGSQLYDTNQQVAGNTSALGGGANYDPATNTYTAPTYNINGTDYSDVGSALAASKTEVKDGKNITVTSTTGTDGQMVYTVATDDEVEFDKVTVGNVVVDATTNDITGLSNTALGGTDFAQSGRAATEEQLNETQDNLVTLIGGNASNQGGTVTTTDIGGTGADNVNDAIETVNNTAKASKTEVKKGQNISVTSTTGSDGQTIYTVATDDDVNFNSVTIGDTAGDNTVLTSTTDGLDVGGDKITNVAAGTISDGSTDAVNGSQLYGLGNNVTNLFGGNATYDGDVINWTDIGGTGENTIDDAIASIKDSADNANQGWNISTNGGTATNVKPADTVDFQGDGNVVVSNTGTEVTVGLADQVTIGTGDTAVSIDGDTGTITTGDVTIDGSTGIITAGQVTVDGDQGTVNGLSNTTWDADNITSGQAATEDQLKQVAADAASNTAKSKSTVTAGDNIEVTTSENTDGSTNYEVATAKDVTFETVTSDTVTAGTVTADTVNVGDVSITSSGIHAGNQKVTNLAAGTVSSDSTDAVNGSQLYGHAQAVQNIIGGSTTYNADTGTYTNNNIGGTGQSTIDAAIGAVNNNVTYLNQRVNDLEDDLSSGIAATAALENAPFIPGKWTYAAGASYYNDQSAIGATLRRTADNGRWSFTGGVAGGTNGSPIVRFGVSGVID